MYFQLCIKWLNYGSLLKKMVKSIFFFAVLLISISKRFRGTFYGTKKNLRNLRIERKINCYEEDDTIFPRFISYLPYVIF